MTTSHDDHDDVVDRGEIDIVHDQEIAVTEARVAIELGLSRGFGALFMVPIRMVATSIRYFDTDGAEVDLVRPGVHHRNETLSGIGDPMILGTYARTIGVWRVGARGGVTLPFGRTEQDPFALGDMDLPHQHVQMVTRTISPACAICAGATFGDCSACAFLFTQHSSYGNARGYQTCHRNAIAPAVRRSLGQRWILRGGAEFQRETAERW